MNSSRAIREALIATGLNRLYPDELNASDLRRGGRSISTI